MTFKEYLAIELEYFNPQYDRFYAHRGLVFRRVNRKGHDVEILYNDCVKKVEEKTRLDQWSDMLVEEVQDTESRSMGWLYYCDAHYLIYGFAYSYPPYRIHLAYLLPDFPAFRSWYLDHREQFRERQSRRGFGTTRFRLVPLRDLHEGGLARVLWSEDSAP